MHATLKSFYLIAACLLMLTGCTHVEQVDDVCVSAIIEERIDKDVQWNRNCSYEEQLRDTIHSLLQKDLTIDSAVEIALLNNPEIQATFEKLGIAHADLVEASLYQNPIFETFFRFPDRSSLSLNTEFSIMQHFLDLLLVPLRKKMAEAEFERTKLEVANAILSLSFEVQETYYNLVAEQEHLKLINPLVELAEIAYQLATAQKVAGNINDLELQTRMNEHLEAGIELSQSQLEIVRLRQRMNKLLGLKSTADCWTINNPLPFLPVKEPSHECLETTALAQRLDLEVARWDVERIARMGALKQWWTYTDLTEGFAGEKDPNGTWTRGPAFSGSIPIFNNGQADRERWCAMYRQSLEHLEVLEIAILAEVRSAREQLMIQRNLVTSYQNELLPLQEQIISTSQRFYNGMALSVYKLLNAKKQELRMQINFIMLLKNYWIMSVELDRSLGGHLHSCENLEECP